MNRIVLLYLSILLIHLVACSSKLNVPRVLLPISHKTPVNFTLEVSDGGCYTWTSSRPDSVKVIPIIENDCSKKAVVTSAGSFSHKTTGIILAQDQNTGELLRCDAIVNHIHKIQIAMKTRELFIEDAPEEFYARALDDQGNEFSSVDGLVFRWTFEGHSSDVESGNEPVLRWVKFADSSYEVIPSIEALETVGFQGHVILIEGMRTGSARVSVRLEDDAFKNVPTVDVNIVVVANLVLDPPELYLLPGTIVPVRLSQIRQGRPEVISLPSSQYYLEADDGKISGVIDTTGSIKALDFGTTNVRLRDRNMKDPDVSHAPYVTVHVVHPHRLSLVLLPERSWATVLQRSQAIQAELFDEQGNLIYPSEDAFVKVAVPEAFNVEQSTKNGTYHHGKAVKLGTHKVKASMRFLKLADGTDMELSPILKASADLEVFESISVTPQRRVLAWDPITLPKHEIKYRAAGGGGSHQFVSSNTSFATISQSGVAKTQSQGWCNISAYVPKYPHVRGDAELFVLPALTMDIVPHIVEIEVGNILHVPVKMTTRLPNGEESEFSDCTDVTLGIELSDRKNFEIGPLVRDAPKLKGCRSIPVLASGIAMTKLVLGFEQNDTLIKDDVILASFRKLRYLEPATRETVLALGSSRVLVFEGGPLPWINKPSGHYRKVHMENDTVASIGQLAAVTNDQHLFKDVYQVEVSCREIGETEVTYRVGNIASSTNLFPVQATAQIKVHCAHPSQVYLIPEVRLPDDTKVPCPLDSSTQRVAIQSYLDLNLITVVKDDQGRKLDSFSSVQLEWNLSNADLGKLNKKGVVFETKQVDGYPILGRAYQLLKPSGKRGPLDVTVKIVGYKETALRQLGLPSQPDIFDFHSLKSNEEDSKMSYTVDLILVDDVNIQPNQKSLFNHMKNKLMLRLSEGSGNFHLDYQPKDVARVQYHALNRTLEVVPLMNGEVKITISDLCLWTNSPAVATIQVVGISRIEVQVSDKIEQGSSVPLTVNLFDTLGQPLDATVLPFIKLQSVLGSSIVRVKALEGLQHMVEGAALGETTIAFTTAAVRSPVVNIQVFAPLKLSPQNVTLVLGATLQVVTSGGPQPDTVVEFTLVESNIATCTSNGIVEGIRLGHSKLVARAVGIDRATSKQRIYSQDQVDVYVIRLSAIRIVSPLTRVRQNTEMPIYFMGLDENETPFSFGTCNPPLKVEWQLSDHLSGQVSGTLLHSGLNPLLGVSHFAARFKALAPGATTLRVRVTSQPNSGQLTHAELTDEISIQVYETLQLVSPLPPSSGSVLVMMPNTELDLRTNLDSSAGVEYVVGGVSDVVYPDGKGNIRSRASLGHASLIATATNNYGVAQSISALVEVRSVSYFMLTAWPVLNLSPLAGLSVIPRGFEVQLRLSYRDALGRFFHSVRSEPTFRPSRFDLTRLSYDPANATLTVHADKVGQTVLQLSDELNPTLRDYLRFDVAEVIEPQQANLVQGDVICFSTPVLSLDGAAGKWSADSKMLEIDEETGVAVAVGVGAAEVSYSISDTQSTSTEVSTNSLNWLNFDKDSADKLVMTDARRTASLHFPLGLRSNGASSLVGKNCSVDAINRFMRKRLSPPVACTISFSASLENSEVSIEEVFSVKAEFDAKSGFYQCVVKAVGSPSVASSTLDALVVLKAHYNNLIAHHLTMPFHPAVFVKTTELHVSDLQPSSHLIITGKSNLLRQLEFVSSDSSACSIYGAQHPSPTSIKIPVRFHPGYYNSESKTPLTITVKSPLTGQQVEIPVRIKIFGDQAQCNQDATWLNVITSVWRFVQDRALAVLSLLGTIAAIYLGYRVFTGSLTYRSTSDPTLFLQPVVNNTPDSPSYSSPFIKRPLWSVDTNHSPQDYLLQQPSAMSGIYATRRSPLSSSNSPLSSSPIFQQRRQDPPFTPRTPF